VGDDTRHDARRRLSVSEAADVLGVTVDAIRSRVKRGTIAHEREGGRVYVLLGADQDRPGHDQPTDQGGGQGSEATEDRTAELIATLREQLQAERQAHAEARRIIAGLVERIPAIEAPQEASEDAETVEEATDELGAERARRETAETTLHKGMAEERRRREEAERERDELRRELVGRGRRTEDHEAAERQQGRGQPHSATGGAQEGVRRPWWRRMFRS